MTTRGVGRCPISGTQLIGTLAAIFLATVVLPPAAAWSLNETRIVQTQTRALSASEQFRARSNEVGFLGTGVAIACGPGRLPDVVPATATARAIAASLPSHRAWLLGATMAPGLFGAGMPTDGWGRCFLLNAGGWATQAPVWVLSAGPNGLVETPMNATTIGGDDIGARLR